MNLVGLTRWSAWTRRSAFKPASGGVAFTRDRGQPPADAWPLAGLVGGRFILGIKSNNLERNLEIS